MLPISNFGFGNLTATAGTVVTCLCPPRKRAYTRLTGFEYTCGSTAHTISLMKALGYSTLSASVAASGTSVTLTSNPGTGTVASGIANNDFVAILLDDGNVFLGKVASLSTLTFTVAALPSAAAAGNRVWFFGAPGDQTGSQTTSKPITQVGYQILMTASVRNSFKDYASGLLQSNNHYEPLLLHSANGTAAGIFDQVTGCHTVA